jgi:2-hydroxy-3-oxopropionate reductase
MLEGRFAPGFRAPLQLKDLAIAAELGAATGQPLPGTETTLRLYREMVEAGHGDLDHSGLFVLLEEQGESQG